MATINGTILNDILTGTAVDDIISGGNGNDTEYGGLGNDTLNGDAGDDVLYGEDGDDTLNGGIGNDILNGGNGNDTATYATASLGVQVSLAIAGFQNTVGAGSDFLISIENLTGSNFNDSLTGDANANRLDGGLGNDVLAGGDGNDYLIGGAGNDILNGGNGIDTASFDNTLNASVNVNLLNGTATSTNGLGSDTLVSIENLIGSGLADSLVGDNIDNMINGGKGNDIIQGSGGNDYLIGGDGIDQIYGGIGNDYVKMTNGSDDADFMDGGTNYGATLGLAELDILDASALNAGVLLNFATKAINFEQVIGTNYNDFFANVTSNQKIDGMSGKDNYLFNLQSSAVHNVEISNFSSDDNLVVLSPNALVSVNSVMSNNQLSTLLQITVSDPNPMNPGVLTSDILLKNVNPTTFSMNSIKFITNHFDSILTGSSSNDVITGTSGSDLIVSGYGYDQISGNYGSDYLLYFNGDYLDNFSGGLGTSDIVDASLAPTGVSLNLDPVIAMSGTELIIGSKFNDSFINIFYGNTALQGNGGKDTFTLNQLSTPETNIIDYLVITDFTTASKPNALQEADKLILDILNPSTASVNISAITVNGQSSSLIAVNSGGTDIMKVTLLGVNTSDLTQADYQLI